MFDFIGLFVVVSIFIFCVYSHRKAVCCKPASGSESVHLRAIHWYKEIGEMPIGQQAEEYQRWKVYVDAMPEFEMKPCLVPVEKKL